MVISLKTIKFFVKARGVKINYATERKEKQLEPVEPELLLVLPKDTFRSLTLTRLIIMINKFIAKKDLKKYRHIPGYLPVLLER